MENIKILLAEDDPNFGTVLKSYLEMNDFTVTWAKNGLEGWAEFQGGRFDLCIFDVMMPKKDGFSLAEDVRAINPKVPIIFLTAKIMKEDIRKGFEIGADDYISKPFDSEELLLRVRAILKRTIEIKPEITQKEFDLGIFNFNYPLRQLTNKETNTSEKLSPKEAALLKMFCANESEVLLRSDALLEIWGDDNYFTARSMDVFITKLRKYLKPDPKLEIVNIHGNGFRLEGK